jgi:photosystem II stability/assembly factor-like uncharacterized protein
MFCLAGASRASASMNEILWKDVSSGTMDLDLQIVVVTPENAELVYTASSNAIYKTTNGGKRWVEVLSFRGTGNDINSIAINPINTNVIYAGAQHGLFRSKDRGTQWKKIFSGVGDLKGSILYVAINPLNPDVLFIGTEAGLFRTDNGGKDWSRGRNVSSETKVFSIAIDHANPHVIYAATDRGVYKSINSGVDWKRILETSVIDNSTGEEDSTSDEADEEETNGIETTIRSIAIDPEDTNTVYVGTPDGLLFTKDSGVTWKTTSSSGLISRDIRHLAMSSADPDNVYAATSRGVFRYSRATDIWAELYKGITSVDIRFLASVPAVYTKHTILWAATKKGIFKTIPSMENRATEAEEVLSMFEDEPSIDEIQKAAIRYAEVHPEKIEGWRKAASKRGWLPDLRVGYDQDRDWQNSYYYYSGTYRGDDITREKDWGLSVSLTWELGDLIWNDDQTSIDTRSRLMVQLRDDVLHEVTRLYFERRRLQVEMLLSPPQKIKTRAEKELRLQELTADIDALTGFYLSKSMSSNKN